MAYVKINTKEIVDLCKELATLSSKYNNKLTSFYERINAIDGKTNEWTGEDAKKYISSINTNKKAYELIGTTLRQYSDLLTEYATNVDLLCSVNKIE